MILLFLPAALAVPPPPPPPGCTLAEASQPGSSGAYIRALAEPAPARSAELFEQVWTLLRSPPDPDRYHVMDPVEMTWQVGVEGLALSSSCELYATRSPESDLVVALDGVSTIHGLLDGTPQALVAAAALYLRSVRSYPSVGPDRCAELPTPWGHSLTLPEDQACGRGERFSAGEAPHPEFLVQLITGWPTQVGSVGRSDGVWARPVLARQQLGRAASDEQAIAQVTDALIAYPLPDDPGFLDELRVGLRALWHAADLTDNQLRALYRDLVTGERDAIEDCTSSDCLALPAFFARRMASSDSGPDIVVLYRFAMVRSAYRLDLPEASTWARVVRRQLAATTELEGREGYLAHLDSLLATTD